MARARLSRALPLFAVGTGLGALFCADRIRIVGGGKEDGTVVTKLALAATDKLEKAKPADAIEPSQGFLAGTVDFIIAAVGAGLPADLCRAEHAKVFHSPEGVCCRFYSCYKSRTGAGSSCIDFFAELQTRERIMRQLTALLPARMPGRATDFIVGCV